MSQKAVVAIPIPESTSPLADLSNWFKNGLPDWFNKPVNVLIGFSALIDATDCNPNGDPAVSNQPRMDRWEYGKISPVCIKNWIRQAVSILFGDPTLMLRPQTIFDELATMYKSLNIDISDKPETENVNVVQKKICEHFWDVRSFGGLLDAKDNDKSEDDANEEDDNKKKKKIRPSAGQVNGTVQIEWAKSVDPIIVNRHSITRRKKTNSEREQGNSSEMGVTDTIDYGLYRINGTVFPYEASLTKFTYGDLCKILIGMLHMFSLRGSMSKHGLQIHTPISIWVHNSPLGSGAWKKTFKVNPLTPPERDAMPVFARSFDDYKDRVAVDYESIKQMGIKLYEIRPDTNFSQLTW